MPKMHSDIVTLGHGSGGLLTHRLLDEGVFALLGNEKLNKQHDGAILNMTGPLAYSTDSFVINPIFFPGGNIGELAVNGTVNDVAMCGGIPKYLSLSFILEAGLPMADLWEVILGVQEAARTAGVAIVTGDTKVVESGKGDKIFINTTGIGEMHTDAHIEIDAIQEGDVVILSGNIGTHGVCILSQRQGLEFETTLSSDTTNLNFLIHRLLNQFGRDIHFLRDPTRGGVATVLTEIAEQRKLGIELYEKDLPIDEQVAGACEMLGLDPLYVANEGIFILICPENIANDVLQTLRSDQRGSNARQVGHTTSKHPGDVILNGIIGGRRKIRMLPGEQLPRIC